MSAAKRITVRNLDYTHDGVALQGCFAVDSAQTDAPAKKRPGVLVVHEWWGLTDYPRQRVQQLAELGYAAFALDMYGVGKTTLDHKQAGVLATPFFQNLALMRARAAAGLAVLQQQPEVDPTRVAAMGYCFGGTVSLQLAYSGAELRTAVCIHGNPMPPDAEDQRRLKASVLVQHGADDPLVSEQTLSQLQAALRQAKADWQLLIYGRAVHAFSNPKADGSWNPGVKYHPQTDCRAWGHLCQHLAEQLR